MPLYTVTSGGYMVRLRQYDTTRFYHPKFNKFTHFNKKKIIAKAYREKHEDKITYDLF